LAKSRGRARLLEALSGCRRVNIDTSALIDYMEDRRPYADLMEAVFRRVSDGELEAILSSIVQMELLVKPIRDHNLDHVGEVIRFTEQTENLMVVEVSRPVAIQAAVIRAEGLAAPDSLILATGAITRCGATITNDGKWPGIVDRLRKRPSMFRGYEETPLNMPKVLYLNDYVDG
jgi:predicted nucleic acid-binding protein